MQVTREDIIEVKSWMDMFDVNYEVAYTGEDDIPPAGIVYCNMEWIPEFFEKCRKTDKEYVVVSGFSDYGLALQSEHPVSVDIIKHFPALHNQLGRWQEAGYSFLTIPPRCRPEVCDIRHKYSIKIDTFTTETMSSIPSNIKKWYLSNTMVQEDIITGLPFGVNQGASEIIPTIKRYDFEDKENLAYINWQNYTDERWRLKSQYIARELPWTTVRETSDLKVEEFFDEIAQHVYVFCPQGNGVDTYRFWETLYLGSIPIVRDCPLVRYFSGLPMLVVKQWHDVTPGLLKEQYETYFSKEELFSFDKAKLSYWEGLINSNVVEAAAV